MTVNGKQAQADFRADCTVGIRVLTQLCLLGGKREMVRRLRSKLAKAG